MTTIADAAAFLNREYGLSGMKLQKILYYAQALALTQGGKALFPEDFQAWRHGPVNREVWQGTLGTGDLTTAEQELLRAAWGKYGHLDAYELSDLTHADAPWRETREDLPDDMNCDRVISQKAMENFYLARELVKRADGTWEHAATSEEAWKVAKVQLVLQKRQHGQLTGEARERFIARQVVATQRLEGITVNLSEWHG